MSTVENRYWADVNDSAENNSHAYALSLVGHGKRVLELGPAAGHVTRALVERGCTVVGIEVDPEAAVGLSDVAPCIVGDLNDLSLIAKAEEHGPFDVVLAGDVLEHLVDPLATLRACVPLLAPGGYVVISVPNIAHADVALALLLGRFKYGDWGLLDRTHISFFTIDRLRDVTSQAGLTILDLHRVVYPVFHTEMPVDPAEVPQDVLDTALSNAEAETYQFVVRAVPHNGDLEIQQMADRLIAANDAARRERSLRLRYESEVLRTRAALEESQAFGQQMYDEAFANARHIEALLGTRTMRVMRPARAVYGRVRRVLR